jgi:hypothetical protein
MPPEVRICGSKVLPWPCRERFIAVFMSNAVDNHAHSMVIYRVGTIFRIVRGTFRIVRGTEPLAEPDAS